MKITKKVRITVILAIVGSFLLGGTVTFAAFNYYADLLARQQPQMEEEISENYREYSEELGTMQHRDMVTAVEVKRQEILEEVNEYARDKALSDANERRQEHAEAIEQEAVRITAELKEFVDSLE